MVLNTVTVYCGSTGGNDPCFLEAAAGREIQIFIDLQQLLLLTNLS